MGTSVSGTPPVPTTMPTRKRPRPPSSPASHASPAQPHPNSKHRHLLPNPNPPHLDSLPNPHLLPLNPSLNPNSVHPSPHSNSVDSIQNPTPASVPAHLSDSLADLESSLDMGTSPGTFPDSTEVGTIPDDFVVAEMMQSLVRVIENCSPVAIVKPSMDFDQIRAQEEEDGITDLGVPVLDSSASGDWPVKENFDKNYVCERVNSCEEKVDGEGLCGGFGDIVDVCGEDNGENVSRGSVLLSSDLRHILEASDADLGIIEEASCRKEENLLHEIDLEEEGGGDKGVVVDAVDLVEEWGALLAMDRMMGQCSSSSSTSSCNSSTGGGGLDEEVVDHVLYGEGEIGPWDLEPDVLSSMDEYVAAWGREGDFELLVAREPSSSVV